MSEEGAGEHEQFVVRDETTLGGSDPPPAVRPDALLGCVQESHTNLVHLGNEWLVARQQQQQQQAPTVEPSKARSSSSNYSPAPFDVAALLDPACGTTLAAQRQAAAEPIKAALEAAGAHPGLVPLLSCYVGLCTQTGHPLLELRGARGIARMAFAAPLGTPSTPQLLKAAKSTATAVGAISALVELLRCVRACLRPDTHACMPSLMHAFAAHTN